jgi:hypothetical protein
MYVATGHLALKATGTPWRLYLRIQLGALATAAVTCAVALVARLLLEGWQASSLTITLVVLAAAGVPWSAGVLWSLSEPDFEPLAACLPRAGARLVETLSRHRRSLPTSNDIRF